MTSGESASRPLQRKSITRGRLWTAASSPRSLSPMSIEKIASGWRAWRWDELMPWNWRPADQLIAQAARKPDKYDPCP